MTMIDGYAPTPWRDPADYSGWPSLHPFPRVRQWLCQQKLPDDALLAADQWTRAGDRGRLDAKRAARRA